MLLYTIGYEGLTSESFFGALARHHIETVVDVRELPISRKPGFSKSTLARLAAERGLNYLHLPALGCPREIRHDYRADGDWTRYTQRFLKYLNTQDTAVRQLAVQALREQCALLCFEADPAYCHRSFVAERVQELSRGQITVIHLPPIPEPTAVPAGLRVVG